MKKIYKRIIIIIGCFFLVVLLLTITSIIIVGLMDQITITNVAVVLGNEVLNNKYPSKRLKSRLDECIRLYRKGFFNKIIVSGGIDKNNNDESLIMKNYLLEHFIDEKNIIMDNKGNNTYLTAINTREIMIKNNFKSIMIISQYYHILRIKFIFKKMGIKNIYNSHSKKFIEIRDVYSILREVVGFWVYFFKY